VNTESVFSIAGMLSSPRQDAHHFQVLVRVKNSRAAYDPTWETGSKRYKRMFANFEDEAV